MSESPSTTIGELARTGVLQFGDGYRTKRSELGTPGLPILRVAQVLDGHIAPRTEDCVSEKFRAAMGPKVSQPGDVVLTTKGTVGRVAIMPADGQVFVYSPQVCYFRLNGPSLLGRYLYYWLKSPEFWVQAKNRKAQTDMADYINLADISTLVITLPLVERQEAVVAILGALDDKIAVNERIGSTALNLAASRYTHGVANDPESRSLPLGDAATWMSGGTPRTTESAYWGGDIPWISALSLKSPWIVDSDRHLTQLGATNGTRLAQPGTVLFVVRGSSLKEEFRIGVAVREVAFGQDCKALTPLFSTGHVLFHAVRSQTHRILDIVDETSIGAGRLATDLMAKLEIQLPGPSNSLSGELEALDKVAINAEAENRSLVELRDVLLPKLMSGQICIRDAEKLVGDAV